MIRFNLLFLLIFLTFFARAETTLTDLQGQKTNFSSLKGKWVFINYWASWCNPCLYEIKALNRFYARNKEKVALFAVNYDAVPLKEQKYLAKKYQIQYPSLSRDPAKTLALGNINAVPATFIFNPEGKLIRTLYGEQTFRSLSRAMKVG
jgi:thiol-disulfide isomerase/thioredoxin